MKMVLLTEEMVIARTKQSNLALITKLNCWGSQLSDVSILRRMPNVTVLSLSVNSISTLADFQYCKKLQDLFVRKNNIKDLNEVCYLQELQSLKSLWLDENPCVSSINNESYRLAVLRALPKLNKLDDVPTEVAELEKAQRFGRVLIHPESQQEYYSDPDDDEYEQKYPPQYKQQEQVSERRSPPSEVIQYADQDHDSYSPEPQHQQPPPQQYQRPREYMQQSNSYESEQEVYMMEVQKQMESSTESESVSRVSLYKEETVETHNSSRPPFNSIPRSRTADGELGCCNRRRICQASSAGRRPPERRTNVLNAVLCLIKELDYPNLEVVEMAVKCRMDELDG